MKLRHSVRERIRWCKSNKLPGQTLKRKRWIVVLIVLTAAFDWFLIVFGVEVILPNILHMAPPYLPKKYAQEYTHISTLKGYVSDHFPVLVFSPDAKTLVTSGHREARLWDVETGEHLLTLETNMNQVRALEFYPDGKTVVGVIASRGNYQFVVWDLNSLGLRHPQSEQHAFLGRQPYDIPSKDKDALTPQVNVSEDTAKIFLHDRTNAITLGHSGSVWILDLVHDRIVHQQVVGTKALRRMQLATFYFATAPNEMGIRWSWIRDNYPRALPPIVLNRQGTRSLSFFTVPMYRVMSLAFSPDGEILASGGYNYEDRLWDVAFAEIRLWDVDTDSQIAVMPAPGGGVIALAFSPDGKTLASGSYDGKILIWDLASRHLLSVISASRWELSINALVFAPDNITLACLAGGTVHLWDITGRTKRGK